MTERTRPAESAGEWETLAGMLDYLRGTVVTKVAGLSTEQSQQRSVEASALSPAALVKHLTGVERFWFSIDFAGADLPWPWSDDNPHGNFPILPGETIDELIAAYEEECARSRAAIAGADLDDVARGEGMTFRLRYALVHMIEETARHCGHLDLLREQIDGVRGE